MFRLTIGFSVCLMLTGNLVAENIDLVTLPKRDSVQLTIYNSEDLTLAREIRAVTFKKGLNRLQFSWAGTLIDPTSVQFRPRQHADQIEVEDTIYPGQKPQHLIWNIKSQFEGEVLVEVSYFTSGLTWQMDYVATSDPTETKMDFRGHVRVFNNSGEQFENAEVRLIVGKINLVQRIADLARQQGIPIPEEKSREHSIIRLGIATKAMDRAEEEADGESREGQKVVKDGVSEYFMFSVEGTETIPNGWSKRIQAIEANDAEFDIVYRMRVYQYGARPKRFFIWRNDEEHQLGGSPLPDGVIRVFRENGNDGLSYLGQQMVLYVPIRAEIEVDLGTDDLVVYEPKRGKTSRSNFRFDRNRVTGWDEKQLWSHSVRNYRAKPIDFELRLQWNGDVAVEPEAATTSFDYRTVETKLKVAASDSAEYDLTATIRHGSNAKQNRVKLTQQ